MHTICGLVLDSKTKKPIGGALSNCSTNDIDNAHTGRNPHLHRLDQ